MSFKVYNFRYRRGTKPNSVRDVLVKTEDEGAYRITGYDRLADASEGGMRKFDKDQMTEVTVYEVTRVIECKDEKSAIELENLGGYDRFGSVVVISKKMIPRKPTAAINDMGGYIKITYGTANVDLPMVGKDYSYDICREYPKPKDCHTFEGVITRLYNEIQKNK